MLGRGGRVRVGTRAPFVKRPMSAIRAERSVIRIRRLRWDSVPFRGLVAPYALEGQCRAESRSVSSHRFGPGCAKPEVVSRLGIEHVREAAGRSNAPSISAPLSYAL